MPACRRQGREICMDLGDRQCPVDHLSCGHRACGCDFVRRAWGCDFVRRACGFGFVQRACGFGFLRRARVFYFARRACGCRQCC
eukprot:324601-Chlamydomonas_euryale.AAC.2